MIPLVKKLHLVSKRTVYLYITQDNVRRVREITIERWREGERGKDG